MAYVYPRGNGSFRRSWKLQRGLVFGLILVTALAAFELFNYATTEYALWTLIGGVQVIGVNWASVLAIAFCAIDFAGLARLFTPEQGRDEPKEVWYLLGAWLLGASMNAVMTWWAVTSALLTRPLGNEVISRETLLTIVPIFVAALVWLTRVLVIGTFGIAGERLFSLGIPRPKMVGGPPLQSRAPITAPRPFSTPYRPSQPAPSAWSPYTASRSASASAPASAPPSSPAPEDEELTYEPVDEEKPTAAPNWPRYNQSRPAPRPRPAYSNVYSMRAYGRELPSSLSRPADARTFYASPGDKADDAHTRFYW